MWWYTVLDGTSVKFLCWGYAISVGRSVSVLPNRIYHNQEVSDSVISEEFFMKFTVAATFQLL